MTSDDTVQVWPEYTNPITAAAGRRNRIRGRNVSADLAQAELEALLPYPEDVEESE